MRIFLTAFSIALLSLALFYGGWILSFILTIILFTLLWTSFFSHKVILSSFTNKKPLEKTPYFRLKPLIQQNFSEKIKVYILEDKKNLQIYFVRSHPPILALSKTLLKEHSQEEFLSLIKNAKTFMKGNNFSVRQKIVSVFLYLGIFLKKVDALISFVFGVAPVNGETRPITRFFINPLLNWICDVFTPSIEQKTALTKGLFDEYSYLDTEHQNELLNPISLTDTLL